MHDQHPHDRRPDLDGPDAQIVYIDPRDIRFELLSEPEMGELHYVVLKDRDGELILTLDVDTDDTILLIPTRAVA